MTSYIALIRKEEGSDFGVDFPDFPGCVTAGRSLDEARRMADEALRLHLDGILEDREFPPEPSSLDAVMKDRLNHDAVAILVDVPVRAQSVRVNVTLPKDLVQEIDRRTRNRSQFLAEAARAKLET